MTEPPLPPPRGEPTLSDADMRVLDFIAEHGFDASRVNELPEADRPRAMALIRQMGVLDAYPADDAGDGVKVRSFVANSAAKAAGIRVGDVVFSIDGTPVRNRDELLLAVARLSLGSMIEVRFRRDGQELAVMLEPRPLGR